MVKRDVKTSHYSEIKQFLSNKNISRDIVTSGSKSRKRRSNFAGALRKFCYRRMNNQKLSNQNLLNNSGNFMRKQSSTQNLNKSLQDLKQKLISSEIDLQALQKIKRITTRKKTTSETFIFK